MKTQTDKRPPKRHKLALLTFVGLLIPVYTIPPTLQSALPDHHLFSVIASVGLMVVFMSYLIMPLMNFLAGDWLRR
ncbi:hypothetical protein [Congregibacter sp.]|uniref:hypothetical protein n=1 Tax=Congregibacter sp. TaxID=2744308 RepID=UPI00385E5283